MLRLLVALLLIANIAFWAWTEGWLDNVVGVRSIGDREPERLTRQVRPESVRILTAGAAGRAEPPPTLACLEAGPFSEAESVAAESAVQMQVPSTAVAVVKVDQPGSWIVYMGRYPNRESQLKKEDELKRRQLAFEEFHGNAALEPGLSLGQFDELGAANRSLDGLVQQGVRTARVVQLTAPTTQRMLRIAKADPALAMRVNALRSPALGRGFAACQKPEGG